MDKIVINGGNILSGDINISGAKNAALPLIAAALLSEDELSLSNIPHLSDITTMVKLLMQLGCNVNMNGDCENGKGRILHLKADNITKTTAPYDIVSTMRASVVIMGPLLARFGHARVSLPGGCAIGARPINYHLDAFEKMGAKISLDNGYIDVTVNGRLHGAEITFPEISVGATENALMAATLADGIVTLHNAAKEPEISDLAHCLNAMGAKISGIDTHKLTINGVKKLHKASHKVIADRIEAGTYAIAAAMTGGKIHLKNIRADIMESTLDSLRKAGVIIEIKDDEIIASADKNNIQAIDITTEAHPGFPTDMQAQFAALMCIANGESSITETIFENRFMHVAELQRMGADMQIDGNKLTINRNKKSKLHGAPVMATDLRASVAMVLAALAANGQTTLRRIYHIDRGYENIEEKLRACGADILRMKDA